MASILKVDTITGVATAGSIAITGEGNSTTTNLQQGLAKAWINLNGTGTIAARDSFNLSSLTDNGTGLYTKSFTSSFGNANYTTCCSGGRADDELMNVTQPQSSTAPTTSSIKFGVTYVNGTNFDVPFVGSAEFGDLA
jgi:hypothetical protein